MYRSVSCCLRITVYAAVLVAPPAGLVPASEAVFAGRPRRDQLAAWLAEPLTPWTLAAAGVACGWLLWAAFTITAARTARARLARALHRVALWRLPRPLRALAAVLLGAAAVSSAASPAMAAAPAAVDGSDAQRPETRSPAGTRPPVPADEDTLHAGETVTVQRGDTLYDLAAEHLGDGNRWPEIVALNRGERDLANPHLIHPGLVLTVSAPTVEPAAGAPDYPPRPRPEPEPRSDPPRTPDCAPGDTAAAPLAGHGPASDSREPTGFLLDSGSWIAISLAAAIVSAAATIRSYRRMRYVPCPVDRATTPAESMPPSRIITRLRHHLRHRTPGAGHRWPRAADTRPHEPATPAPTGPDLLGPGWPPAGLGLTGPGAAAAARGVLIAAYAAPAADTSHQVIVTAGAAATLFGTHTLPGIPGMTVAADLPAAVQLVEADALRRARTLDSSDIGDDAGEHPDAPARPILLVADADTASVAALDAVLPRTAPLGVRGLLLGAWPPGVTLTVAADGVSTTDAGARPTGRLTVLTPADTLDLLAVLAEPGDAREAPAPPETADTATHTTPEQDPATPVGTAPPAGTSGTTAPEAGPSSNDTTGPEHGDGRPVRVQVLGGARIDGIEPGYHLRAKSLELLVYLATHGGSAADTSLLADLLPEARMTKAPSRLHTYVYALRQALQHAGGPATYLTRGTRRYTLNSDAVDVDLWQLQGAIRDADTATDRDTRIAALRRAVDLYTGPLADGHDYEWAEPHREAIRRQVIDAHTTLADALTGHPDEQLAVLQAAIRHDPYAEHLYRQAMHAHAALGQPDGIRALRQNLTRQLADIDTTPSAETLHVADDLIAATRTGAGPRPKAVA